jgi:hypothetical protein
LRQIGQSVELIVHTFFLFRQVQSDNCRQQGRLIRKEQALEDTKNTGNDGYLQFKLSVAFCSSFNAYCSASMASSPFFLCHCRHTMDSYQVLLHSR